MHEIEYPEAPLGGRLGVVNNSEYICANFVPVACKRFNAVKAASSACGLSRGASSRRARNSESKDCTGTGAARRQTVFAIKKEKTIAGANFVMNQRRRFLYRTPVMDGVLVTKQRFYRTVSTMRRAGMDYWGETLFSGSDLLCAKGYAIGPPFRLEPWLRQGEIVAAHQQHQCAGLDHFVCPCGKRPPLAPSVKPTGIHSKHADAAVARRLAGQRILV